MSNSNNSNSSNNSNIFYSIWRDSYIRGMVRARLLANLQISLFIQQLDHDDIIPLTKLSSLHKLKNNINIECYIPNFDNLLNYPNRYIINKLFINLNDSPEIFNLQDIHEGVHTLMLVKDTQETPRQFSGTLPSSLTDLSLIQKGGEIQFIQNLLQTLHTTAIQKLWVTGYTIDSSFVVPRSLSTFCYEASYESLKWIVVSPNQVLQGCKMEIKSLQDFPWLDENKWIVSVILRELLCDLVHDLIPQHVSEVSIEYPIHQTVELQADSLPKMLESFQCLNRFTFLPNILPIHLKSLVLSFNPIPRLETGFLPPSLEKLHMPYYNEPLDLDVLPASLTDLIIPDFNHPLDALVLPCRLKFLTMRAFTQPTLPANSLPSTLVSLAIPSFKGSFGTGSEPLDKLNDLYIDMLDRSISPLLQNVVNITITTYGGLNDGVSLFHTSIRNLVLSSNKRVTIDSLFLPQHLQTLESKGIKFNPIPTGCKCKIIP
ncbi:hypothetical protein CYY_003178 [Polysphondylium violaceum]|uniref:FNIP repeat-containing protein n=1 Tax=Polysphondylium violaceum TaxID=133409 RepID=A0A8J4Q061_9MYCE|nr:hypothetical protein CYY_003178 [Polysphondylium violaceum]